MLAATNCTTETTTVDWLFRRSKAQRRTGRHASAQHTMDIQIRTADGGYCTNPLGLTSAANYQAALDWLRELGLEDELTGAFFLQMGVDRGGVPMRVLNTDDVEGTEIYRTGREALYLIASKLSTRDFFVGAQTRGIACGAVYAPDETLADEHYRFRGYPVEVEHPELGRSFTYPGLPFTGETIPDVIMRAPLVGEHTDEVLAALREDRARHLAAEQAV
jgi:hypothetical protein